MRRATSRRSRKPKILVVTKNRRHYGSVLQEKGYEVQGPCDPDEAQSRCLRESYDLVLLDLLPNPSAAFRLCAHIRNTIPGARVVFVMGPPSRIPSIPCPPNDVIQPDEGPQRWLERVKQVLAA